MLKLLKYLKKSAGTICLIVLLLGLQAYCDLSLPTLTSQIVDTGIMKKGIADAVPSQIRAAEMETLFLFMEESDIHIVSSNYTLKDDGLYHLNKINSDTRTQLNDILGKSMLIVTSFGQETEESNALRAQLQLPSDGDLLQTVALLPDEQRNALTSSITKQLDAMSDIVITQAYSAYLQGEYEAQGIDLEKMQQNYIIRTGGKMILLALLIMLAAVSVTFLSCRVAAGLSHDLRNLVYKKVNSFSNKEFDKFSTASLITRTTNDIQQIQLLFMMIFRIILYAPILGIGGVIKVFSTNASMSWIIALGVILILGVVMVLFAVAMPRFKKLQTLIDKLNLVTREILTGIPVIRAFSTQKHEEDRFEDANKQLTKTNLFVNRCMSFMMPVMILIMNGITVLITYQGAVNIDNGSMQVGDMMAFIQYTMQIIMAFLMITMISIMIPRASVSAARIQEVLETDSSLNDPKQPVSFQEPLESLTFDQVSFAYPDASENVLTDISFTAKKGETTAFIGSTGSGKSTLVNLIPRFYDVTKGSILFNDTDIRDLTQFELHEKIGYVPQKGVLFSGTIDSNLRYGCESASMEDIKKAASIAQASDFIQEKPEQYQTPIAQGGTNVSGGQKQRLSIARAIAKKPDIYIFDDSFSALDYKTDVALRRALQNETTKSITLIVAQRISTILNAEQIIVLDEGKIVGKGTHEELMKTCEVYQQIAMSQLSKEELNHA